MDRVISKSNVKSAATAERKERKERKNTLKRISKLILIVLDFSIQLWAGEMVVKHIPYVYQSDFESLDIDY